VNTKRLRQLSSGDGSKMTGLPPSPGLAFQLAKHRYSREDMLGIFENIEKKLFSQPPPPVFLNEFEELYRKDIQRPILLSQPTLEEQVSKLEKNRLEKTGLNSDQFAFTSRNFYRHALIVK
jgi:hypothetical protein